MMSDMKHTSANSPRPLLHRGFDDDRRNQVPLITLIQMMLRTQAPFSRSEGFRLHAPTSSPQAAFPQSLESSWAQISAACCGWEAAGDLLKTCSTTPQTPNVSICLRSLVTAQENDPLSAFIRLSAIDTSRVLRSEGDQRGRL